MGIAPLWPRPEGPALVRKVLEGTGYLNARVKPVEGAGLPSTGVEGGPDGPIIEEPGETDPAFDTIVRLFAIGASTNLDDFREAIAPMDPAEWHEAGFVHVDGSKVHPKVRLHPHEGLVIAFDNPPVGMEKAPPDYVMPVAASSATLARITVPTSGSFLDVGAGCGVLALLAARTHSTAVASDMNPRAASFADFNVRLNELDNVECVVGDLFEPVEGRRFHHIVSNPPFVISPETSFIYRDAGTQSDQISERIVRAAPKYLEEGGYYQMLVNWARVRGEDWKERLAAWFEGSGCDVWVMEDDVLEVSLYASRWIRGSEALDRQGFTDRLDQWLAYYEKQDIEAVGFGAITLRKTAGRPGWVKFDSETNILGRFVGRDIARIFEGRGFLADLGDDDRSLLEQKLRIHPSARLRNEAEPGEQMWDVIKMHLVMAEGTGPVGVLDPYVAQMLARADGTRTLRELVEGIADGVDAPYDNVVGPALELVKTLISEGFLTPN